MVHTELHFHTQVSPTVSHLGNRVFVYATLRDKWVQERALQHIAKMEADAAILPGHSQVLVHLSGSRELWPNVVPNSPMYVVTGEILDLSDSDLVKLDKWEDKYHRVQVSLVGGDTAWMYILRGRYANLIP